MPTACAFGSVFTRLSPTSRGLGRCVSFRIGRGREQTTAGPRAGACRLRGDGRRCLALWARGAAGMRGRRCLPCGQRRCRVARRIMACRGRERGLERFAHQGTFPARRGTGERAAPRRGRRYTPSRRQNAPASRQNLPHHPTAANAALYKARLMPVAENLPGARPRPAFRACLRPIHTCLQPIRAFYGFPTPVYGHSAPFTALPRPQKSASHPSRYRLISQTFPQGERRALPAPAQGANPLRIPFWKTTSISPVSPPPKRRRRTAPARGPSAVYSHLHPIRNETQNARPLLVGRAFVDLEPTALAVGTADYSRILVTTPEPTVRPPSRMAKRRPSSHAIGVIKVISMSMLSPGMTISTPSGSLMLPVTSVVRK